MTINLPESHLSQLSALASDAGYDSVEQFAQDCLMAITSDSVQQDQTEWTEQELREFAAACDQGMEDARAGRVMSVEEARRRSHERAAMNWTP